MKAFAASLAAILLAAPALAQSTPPASSSSPAATATESQNAATSSRDTSRPGRGPFIKLEGPNGSEITVRCADGDTTRACADIVTQLIDRMRSMASDTRRDRDRDGYGDRDRYRGRDY